MPGMQTQNQALRRLSNMQLLAQHGRMSNIGRMSNVNMMLGGGGAPRPSQPLSGGGTQNGSSQQQQQSFKRLGHRMAFDQAAMQENIEINATVINRHFNDFENELKARLLMHPRGRLHTS